MRSRRSKKTLVSFISEDCKKTLSRLTPFSVPFHNSLMAALGLVIITFTFFSLFGRHLNLYFPVNLFLLAFIRGRSFALISSLQSFFSFVIARLFLFVQSFLSYFLSWPLACTCISFQIFVFLLSFVAAHLYLYFSCTSFGFPSWPLACIFPCFPFNSFSFPSWPTCTSSYFINSFSFLHGR